MPGAYTIDAARSLVLSRGWGALTDRDLLAHVHADVAFGMARMYQIMRVDSPPERLAALSEAPPIPVLE